MQQIKQLRYLQYPCNCEDMFSVAMIAGGEGASTKDHYDCPAKSWHFPGRTPHTWTVPDASLVREREREREFTHDALPSVQQGKRGRKRSSREVVPSCRASCNGPSAPAPVHIPQSLCTGCGPGPSPKGAVRDAGIGKQPAVLHTAPDPACTGRCPGPSPTRSGHQQSQFREPAGPALPRTLRRPRQTARCASRSLSKAATRTDTPDPSTSVRPW